MKRRFAVLFGVLGVGATQLTSMAHATTVPFELRYSFPVVSNAIATGPSGDVFALDKASGTVTRLTYAGEPITTFGAGTGSGQGQFTNASGIAVAPDGSSFVADTGNSRVVEFDIDGKFVRSWATSGTLNGVAVGNDRVYVSSTTAVTVYNLSGVAQDFFAVAQPQGVAVDPVDGTVYVSNAGTGRDADSVVEFSPGGLELTPVGGGRLTDPTSVTAFGGVVTVYDAGADRADQFLSDGTFVRSFGPFDNNHSVGELGLATDCSGNLFATITIPSPTDSRYPAIGVLGDPSARLGTCPLPHVSFTAGFGGVGGVAIDRAGNSYVSDNVTNHMMKFDRSGVLRATWAGSGTAPADLNAPKQVAVDPSGNVYVVDSGNSRVVEYGATGRFIRAIGFKQLSSTIGTNANSIAVDASGRIALGDYVPGSGARVLIVSPAGTLLHEVFPTGNAVKLPLGLSVDSAGHFLATIADFDFLHVPSAVVPIDAATGAVGSALTLPNSVVSDTVGIDTVLLGDGRLLTSVAMEPEPGSANYDNYLPTTGLIYLAADGHFLSRTGSDGSAPGEFDKQGIGQLALDCAGDVAAVDGARVQWFGDKRASCRWLPTATTGAASSITRTSAKLAGRVNPSAQATTWYLQWGTSTKYGHVTKKLGLPGDNRALSVSSALSGLTRHTRYHYRIVATNASGTKYGVDRTFTTAS